jgi:type I restriction enzyme S subunit
MSWSKVKLGEFLKVRDNRFKPNDKSIADLKRIDKIDFSGEIFISDKQSNTDMILIKKGDLVISGINVEKGAMAVYTGEEDITATIHYSSYSFDENEIDIEFLKFFLKSIEFKNALKEQVPGGIKTEIKPKHLLPLVVEIPTDIKDQKEVVEILKSRNSKVDAISTELTYQLTLVKKLRQQLLQDAVQGRFDFAQRPADEETGAELLKKIKAEKATLRQAQGAKKVKKEKELPPIKPEEIPFEIPENWVWCRLGEIIISAKDGPHFSPQYAESGIPFISTRNISIEGIDFTSAKYISEEYHSEISRKCKPEKGDILYTKGGTTGIATVNTYDIEFNVWVHVAVLRMSKTINPFYLKNCLNSPHCYKQSQELTRGISNQDLGLTRMVNITIPLPPIKEQNRIVQKLDKLMQYCNALEASIQQSASQNEKLLQQVLREALRPAPSNTGKEPVEV